MTLTAVIERATTKIAGDEKWGQITYRASFDLVGVTEVTSKVGSGHQLTVDEPASFGGGNAGPGPVEYALTALGSCQAITYQFWAARLGIVLDTIHIDMEGDLDLRGFLGLDDTVRPGLGAVRVRVVVTGPEPAERYEALAAAVDAHCPVLDVFAGTVPVGRTLSVA